MGERNRVEFLCALFSLILFKKNQRAHVDGRSRLRASIRWPLRMKVGRRWRIPSRRDGEANQTNRQNNHGPSGSSKLR